MNAFLLDDGRLRSGWRFGISAVVVVIANFVAMIVAYGFAGNHARLLEVIYRPLLVILELGAFYLLTKLFDQPKQSVWQYNGLGRYRWFQETLVGALLGFVLVGLAVGAIALFFNLHIVSLRINVRTLIVGTVVFGVILAAAMAEELAFRGYPFQRLVEGMGPVGAILVLSALFGAVHLQNPHVSDNRLVQIAAFTNTLLIGIVLALAYLRTRALWFPFGLHFAWNAALGLFFGLPVSGTNDFSVIVHSRAVGPEWLLGGAYGIEAGFIGTLVILLGLLYVVFFVKAVQPVPEPQPTALDQPPAPGIQFPSGTPADL